MDWKSNTFAENASSLIKKSLENFLFQEEYFCICFLFYWFSVRTIWECQVSVSMYGNKAESETCVSSSICVCVCVCFFYWGGGGGGGALYWVSLLNSSLAHPKLIRDWGRHFSIAVSEAHETWKDMFNSQTCFLLHATENATPFLDLIKWFIHQCMLQFDDMDF